MAPDRIERPRFDLLALVLSIIRDPRLAEAILRKSDPRDAVLRMSRAGRREIVLSPEAVVAVDRASAQLSGSEWIEAVEKCLEDAGGQARSILNMRYRDGMSGAEIARRTKTTATSVHEMLSRARATLARCAEGRLS